MTMEKEKNPGLLDQLVIQVTRLYDNIGLGEATQPFKICVQYLEGTKIFFETPYCETVFISKKHLLFVPHKHLLLPELSFTLFHKMLWGKVKNKIYKIKIEDKNCSG